jgi:hypothetical protein
MKLLRLADVPLHQGKRLYWSPLDDGDWSSTDAESYKYTWIELFDRNFGAPYYYNRVTRKSQWLRPPDLGWRKVCLTEATSKVAPPRVRPSQGKEEGGHTGEGSG